MLDTLLAGLILALVSGATFVAYNHPKAFRRLANRALVTILALWSICSVYTLTVTMSWRSAIDHIKVDPEAIKAIRADIDHFDHRLGISHIIIFSALLFLLFLINVVTDIKDNSESEK